MKNLCMERPCRVLLLSVLVALTLDGPAVGHAADKKELSASHNAPATSSAKRSQPMPLQSQRSLELNEQGVVAIKARKFAEAESLFKRAIETDSRNLTAVFNLAGMYITNKKENEAITLLAQYTKDFPTDAGLHARLGDAYFSAQNAKAATASYEQALALDAAYTPVFAKLGTLYALQNKLEKAASMYERAVKANPKDAQSLQNLGNIYLGLGKPQQAISTAKRSLQVASSADAYVTLGNAYRDLKDSANALIAFKRAQELGYKDPTLAKVIEELQRGEPRKTT